MQNWLSLTVKQGLKEAFVPEKRLTLAQKAVIHWAKVDDYAAILDIDCSNGGLLQYYLKRYRVRACGMVESLEELTASRMTLENQAEVLKAGKHDIPWRSCTFDTVFMTKPIYKPDGYAALLSEIKRVMKPGGQILIAVPGLHLLSRFGLGQEQSLKDKRPNGPFSLMDILHQHGFTDVSMRLSSVQYATVIAHLGVPVST